jgi:TolB-like protein
MCWKGSKQRGGKRLRVNVQLIEVGTVWAERGSAQGNALPMVNEQARHSV